MKLHIGCGKKYLPGYSHMDIMPSEHIDYIGNANDLSGFEDNSIDEIYACHVLEHFNRNEIGGVLKEWYRVIRSGGAVRIAVPDFEAIVAEYTQTKNLNAVLGLLYGGQNYEYNFHYQAYDFERLKSLLEDAGFSSVQKYDWKLFFPANYDDYSRAYIPHMDFENGRLMSLNIIAHKD